MTYIFVGPDSALTYIYDMSDRTERVKRRWPKHCYRPVKFLKHVVHVIELMFRRSITKTVLVDDVQLGFSLLEGNYVVLFESFDALLF